MPRNLITSVFKGLAAQVQRLRTHCNAVPRYDDL